MPEYAEFIEMPDNRPMRSPQLDPWRLTWPDSIVMSIAILEQAAQPGRLVEISRDHERLATLEEAIRSEGLRERLRLNVDDIGNALLKEGHHRLIVARRLGYRALPVEIKRVERVKLRGALLADIIEALLRGHA